MLSPRFLTNVIIFTAICYVAGLVWLVFVPPYTGFELEANIEDQMVVTRADDWVKEKGLRIGDIITEISATNGLTISPSTYYYPPSTTIARQQHDTIGSLIESNNLMSELLSSSPISISTADGKQLTLELNHPRPVGSISWEVWWCIFLGLLCWLLPALVWAWRPRDHDISCITLSGLGLGLATISASFFYQIEMYFLPAPLYWLIFELVGVGNFMLVVFAATCFLYFPQALPHAARLTRIIIGSVCLYTLVVLLDGWDTSRGPFDQLLYFSYNEVYIIELLGYLVILLICVAQWFKSRNNPLANTEAIWILFAAALTPLLFFLAYFIPVVTGAEAILNRTWTTTLIAFGFFLISIGVARLRFFHFEKHTGAIYQWTLLSLLFVGMDAGLVYFTNINLANSTAITTAIILFIYFPLRQLLYGRMTNARQRNYQGMFSEAADRLVEGSLANQLEPAKLWQSVLEGLFNPISIEPAAEATKTHLSDRGQSLIVAPNRFAEAMALNYAEGGTRLFDDRDTDLVNSLGQLFVRLLEHKDGIAKGQLIERERIRRDLHDQIGSKLISMIYTSESKQSKDLASETLDQLRELLKAIKQTPVEIPILVADLRQVCEQACKAVGLNLNWDDNILDDTSMIPSFHYFDILSMFRELINNTVKHAGASDCWLSVRTNSEGLALHYKDNGRGFDIATVSRGNGLNNIFSRAEDMNATLRWKTSEGTSVHLSVPVKARLA